MTGDDEDREELDEDELLIASQAYVLEGKSFAPTDKYLPACERLVDREWLSKWEADIEGEDKPVAVYSLTPAARAAMKMNDLLTVEPERLN